MNHVIIKSPNVSYGPCPGASSTLNTWRGWGEGGLPLQMSPKLTQCDPRGKEWGMETKHKSTRFPDEPEGGSLESSSWQKDRWWISIPHIQLKVPQQPSFPLATPLFLKWSWIKQLVSVPVSGFNWCESLTDWWGRSNQYPLEGGWSKRISHPAAGLPAP